MKFLRCSPLIKAFSLARPGWSAALFYGLMITVATWICLMLYLPMVAETALQRMHLATRSFPAFAAQQISPAMYNFSNEGWQEGMDMPLEKWRLQNVDHAHYYNHFPVRNLTWVERENLPLAGIWGYYCSRYQGRELWSKYELQPASEGGWNVLLRESFLTNAD
jgi:hypothetical protein